MLARTLVWVFMTIIFSSCTNETSYVPEIPKYESETELMVNICTKFVNDEGDVQKLHDVALAVQTRRVVSCSDYNGECTLYNDCINSVIQSSRSKNISFEDRKKLKEIATDLKKAVQEGKEKLRNAFFSK